MNFFIHFCLYFMFFFPTFSNQTYVIDLFLWHIQGFLLPDAKPTFLVNSVNTVFFPHLVVFYILNNNLNYDNKKLVFFVELNKP